LAASEQDLPRFRSVAGLEQLANASPDQREGLIERTVRTMPAATWMERFGAADIGAAICDSIDMIRARSSNAFDGTPGTDRGSYSFSTYADHPSGHRVTQLDPYGVRVTDAKIYAPKPAEKYGNSTRRVLSSLGYREDHIDALRDRKVI